MSNIIILAGSERKDGNTDMLVGAFRKFHLEDAGMVLVQGAKDIGDVKNTDGLDSAYKLGLSIE